MLKVIVILSFAFALPLATNGQDAADEFSRYSFYLSEVMLHDVVNPPAASRFYAYSMLASYQVVAAGDPNGLTMTEAFVSSPEFQKVRRPEKWSKSFCAIYAMLEVGRQIIPSGYMLEARQENLIQNYKKRHKLSSNTISENITFAVAIAEQVVRYSKTDGYGRLSTLMRYTPKKNIDGSWYPTPPEYMAAVEPHWRTIRTFFLDSAQQFAPPPPAAFDTTRAKSFFGLTKEVFDVSRNLTLEQRTIAAFWDCNPFAVQYSGHLAIGLKKISPGGHWIGITGIACRKVSASLEKTVIAHTIVALTLSDAFISCWDEKYRSDRIRPEAVINKYIDPAWKPLLQTPPFPEYPSGHSVISTASAIVLTYLFGENFSFTDTTEEIFGLAPRHFDSFSDASKEAAISRLYGGIHFRDAIEHGQDQGKHIGNYIIEKINDRVLSGVE